MLPFCQFVYIQENKRKTEAVSSLPLSPLLQLLDSIPCQPFQTSEPRFSSARLISPQSILPLKFSAWLYTQSHCLECSHIIPFSYPFILYELFHRFSNTSLWPTTSLLDDINSVLYIFFNNVIIFSILSLVIFMHSHLKRPGISKFHNVCFCCLIQSGLVYF